ncbi:unnamed protein product [Wickerhamomyces anomalus]
MLKSFAGVKLPTSVYHQLPRARLANGPLLIFIPGNPGVISYYVPYFKLLGAQFPTLEILGIAQAGHQIPDGFNGDEFDLVVDLQGQIDHKVAVIEEFLSDGAGANRDVLIMGHSVGSWMMERIVLKLLDKVNFKFIGFITPTIIDIHKSEKGRTAYPLIKILPYLNILLAKFSSLLGYLPERITRFLLSQTLKNPPAHALESAGIFISNPQHIRQSIGLATEELNVIHNDWEFFENEFLKQTTTIPKWFFFSNVDHWVTNETQKEITERVESVENVFVENSDEMVHSFCVKQSEEFAKVTSKALNELYFNH